MLVVVVRAGIRVRLYSIVLPQEKRWLKSGYNILARMLAPPGGQRPSQLNSGCTAFVPFSVFCALSTWLTRPRAGLSWGLGPTGCQAESLWAAPGSKASCLPLFRTLYGARWAKIHPSTAISPRFAWIASRGTARPAGLPNGFFFKDRNRNRCRCSSARFVHRPASVLSQNGCRSPRLARHGDWDTCVARLGPPGRPQGRKQLATP